MKQVIVRQFGGPEQLCIEERPTPIPGPGQVLIRLTSIGMNHADLMARRGSYKISSGEPPFTPGLEGGGVIEAIGEGVDDARLGQRVTISPAGRQAGAGTYRSHYVTNSELALPAPAEIPDEQLGALWLSYLTAWGCLVWKHGLKGGEVVAMTAASSAVAMAAAQVVKLAGGTTIGLTMSPEKVEDLLGLTGGVYDHVVTMVSPDGQVRPWYRDLKGLTDGRGIDVIFDPIAAGEHLETEIRCLAPHGTVWIYGLLGLPGKVDLSPLIIKHGAIRGWWLNELWQEGCDAWRTGCQVIFDGFAQGLFRQHIGRIFKLEDVASAHDGMEKRQFVGKLILVPP